MINMIKLRRTEGGLRVFLDGNSGRSLMQALNVDRLDLKLSCFQ